MKATWLLASVCAGCMATTAATASEPYPMPEPPPQSELIIRPYGWTPFFKGSTTAGNKSVNIDTNIFKILEVAREFYGFMGYAEYRRGKISVLTDADWAKININDSVVKSGRVIPGVNGTLVANANVWFDLAIIESTAAYEVARWGGGSRASIKDGFAFVPSTALDITAGTRYWFLKPDLNLNVTATIDIPALGLSRTGGGNVSAAPVIDWWDPLIGFRLRHQPAPDQEFVVRGDIGGFGAGSQRTWQATAGYSFQTHMHGYVLDTYLGYRALYIDYEQGEGKNKLEIDLLSHGPVLGMNFRW
jgi:hypothetical protein